MHAVNRIQINESQQKTLSNTKKLSTYLLSLGVGEVDTTLHDLAKGIGVEDVEDVLRLAAATLGGFRIELADFLCV